MDEDAAFGAPQTAALEMNDVALTVESYRVSGVAREVWQRLERQNATFGPYRLREKGGEPAKVCSDVHRDIARPKELNENPRRQRLVITKEVEGEIAGFGSDSCRDSEATSNHLRGYPRDHSREPVPRRDMASKKNAGKPPTPTAERPTSQQAEC